MRLTAGQLRQIIKEELESIVEQGWRGGLWLRGDDTIEETQASGAENSILTALKASPRAMESLRTSLKDYMEDDPDGDYSYYTLIDILLSLIHI